MLPDFAEGSPGWEAAFGAAIFGASLVAAFLVSCIFNRVLKALAQRTKTVLDDLMVQAIGLPIFLFVLVFGPYIALTATTYLDDDQDLLDRGLLAAEIVIVGYALRRIASAVLIWYAEEIVIKTTAQWGERVLPILRRFVDIGIFSVVVLVVLQSQGLNISPLLAGLGIGGLAVALAIQPTLTNFIAGTYMVTESGIGVGDYIDIEGGPSGWVTEVGWRTTKIRNFWNNMIIIPNSKLADSIVTNYQGPDPALFAMVECGVSYESDLEQVNDVALEATNKVLQESEGADLTYSPVVRFREFGDSNINFIVVFKVRGFVEQFVIKDQIVRGIHRRFTEEGIEINYPVRKLVYPPGRVGTEGVPLSETKRARSGDKP